MKSILLVVTLLVLSCNETRPSQQCTDYEITLQDYERQIDILFEKEDRLTKVLENAQDYILLLEEENLKLKKKYGE